MLTAGSKSQLAIQYAYKLCSVTPRPHVFWVQVSNKVRFEQAYKDLVDKLELPGRNNQQADILQLIKDWLCDVSNGQWAIILDNAGGEVAGFLHASKLPRIDPDHLPK